MVAEQCSSLDRFCTVFSWLWESSVLATLWVSMPWNCSLQPYAVPDMALPLVRSPVIRLLNIAAEP